MLSTRTSEIALSRGRKFVLGERFVGTLAIAPIGGGSPREVAYDVEDADWNPRAGKLAIAHAVGDEVQIEYPAGTVLYKYRARSGFCGSPPTVSASPSCRTPPTAAWRDRSPWSI